MVHANGSAWSHLPSIFIHCQSLEVPANDIPVFPTSRSADFSAGSRRYSLCAVWICQQKEGHSYVFSRWISRYILSIPYDKLYTGRHCIHQSHISGPHQTPPPTTLSYNSTRMDTHQSQSALFRLDSLSSISFCSQLLLFWRSSTGISTFYSLLSWLNAYWLDSKLETSPFELHIPEWELPNFHWCFSVWVVASILGSTVLTYTPTFQHPSAGWALFNLHRCSSVWIGCSSAWIGAPWYHYSLLTPRPTPFRRSSVSLDAP